MQDCLTLKTMKPLLGIIDWGVGGVSIIKLVKSRLGNLPVIYFSDTGVTPYGRMSRDELLSRVNKVIAFLRSQGVSHVVVGCNAASTVIPFLHAPGMKVEGVIESAVRLTASMRPPRLALLGGRRTVASGIYRRAFAEEGINVTQRIAQSLSALIEAGDVSSTELSDQCRRILLPVKNCSHLLLACTHYPAIMPVLKEFVSDNTVIINPVGELIERIKRWKLPAYGTYTFITTGEPEKMNKAAWNAFGYRIKKARRVDI